MFPPDLTQKGSEFPRVGAATEKTLVTMFVLTLGTKSRSENGCGAHGREK